MDTICWTVRVSDRAQINYAATWYEQIGWYSSFKECVLLQRQDWQDTCAINFKTLERLLTSVSQTKSSSILGELDFRKGLYNFNMNLKFRSKSTSRKFLYSVGDQKDNPSFHFRWWLSSNKMSVLFSLTFIARWWHSQTKKPTFHKLQS